MPAGRQRSQERPALPRFSPKPTCPGPATIRPGAGESRPGGRGARPNGRTVRPDAAAFRPEVGTAHGSGRTFRCLGQIVHGSERNVRPCGRIVRPRRVHLAGEGRALRICLGLPRTPFPRAQTRTRAPDCPRPMPSKSLSSLQKSNLKPSKSLRRGSKSSGTPRVSILGNGNELRSVEFPFWTVAKAMTRRQDKCEATYPPALLLLTLRSERCKLPKFQCCQQIEAHAVARLQLSS